MYHHLLIFILIIIVLTIIILCTLYKKVLDNVGLKQGIFSGTMRLMKHAYAYIEAIQELINTI